jgi:hypothetical protein
VDPSFRLREVVERFSAAVDMLDLPAMQRAPHRKSDDARSGGGC